MRRSRGDGKPGGGAQGMAILLWRGPDCGYLLAIATHSPGAADTMIRFIRLRSAAAALMALAALVTALPTLAQSAVQANGPVDAAYGDLYSAMREGVDDALLTESALTVLAREFAANADFAAAEAASPGLIAEVVDGMRPILVGQSDRLTAMYRPATLALFARHLTPPEATSIAAFYRSDIGRKLMGGLSQTYSPDQTLSSINGDGTVTSDQVAADIAAASNKVIGQMSEDELQTIGRMALANPALRKLGLIGGGVKELRTMMENEPLTAEESAAIEALIEGVFNQRFGVE